MKPIYSFLILFIVIVNINQTTSHREKKYYKCGVDALITKDIIGIDSKPIDRKNPLNRRRLREIDEDGFKNFSIYVDTTNLEKQIELYNFQSYKDFFINSIKKAVETLNKLLKVKAFEIDFNLSDDILYYYFELDYWDEEKFGTEAYDKGINIFNLDIDLLIFATFEDMEDEDILASASPMYYLSETNQPIVGMVYINPNINFSLINSEEYFKSIILHEFTHILGFEKDFLNELFQVTFQKNSIYYINSNKVIQTAKKYFNCSDIDGVQLEDYGGDGTAGSHWEARILLGEYMNGYLYPEEQVISEFTLALLEDFGVYKANYYTGGLMRYGKNKGCEFIKEKCLNSSYQTNPYFENEFFDTINSDTEIDYSCSSGRQSRTYHYYNIFGGKASADYCPVAEGDSLEQEINYYIGHCSNKGGGEYGTLIKSKDSTYKTNGEMKIITGETNSDNSFCYLSSFVNKVFNNSYNYSKTVRAVCYETFCSSKSLTVKINNDFIVCPREGGKIESEEYDGYLLCPDYNLICSGTILCNNMFECVDKKSEIKEESYIYDYTIKTSQNIGRAEEESANNETNYELSDDGKCPKYCSRCLDNKICVKCKDGFFRAKKEEQIICLQENELIEGFFLNGEIYYECLENCKNCSNENSCQECKYGFELNENKCIGSIENCKDYSDINICERCKKNFAFKENNRTTCHNINEFEEYYSKDDEISYYPCDGNGNDHIQNCKKCNYNKNQLECSECKKGYILLDEENDKCYSKNNFDNNKSYYYINDTNVKTCSKEMKNCFLCENEQKCIQCSENYYLLNDITNKCYNINDIVPIEEYYLNENHTTYYSCKYIDFNSFSNCKECSGNNTCSFCKDGYSFYNGDKSQCINLNSLEENSYYEDPNDPSNVNTCSIIDSNCIECSTSEECLFCSENYGIFNRKPNKCFLLNDYYDKLKENKIYLLGIEPYYYYLYLYMFFDFEIPNDFYYMYINITYPNYYLRDLEETEEIEFEFYYLRNNIAIFKAYLPFYIENISDIKIDFNNIKDNKNNQNNYILDTEYALYIGNDMDFFQNLTDIKVYKVKFITKGKNFNLVLNEDISIEKNITIQFFESQNKSNIIEANCILSFENDGILPCSVNEISTKKYVMKNYFYLDRKKGQLISINIDKPSKYDLIIKSENESETQSETQSKKKLSLEMITIIVLGILLLFSLIFIINIVNV